MRIFLSACRTMIWILLVFITIMQVMTVIGLYQGNSVELFNPTFLIIATGIMAVSVVLFFALRRYKLIPLIAAGMAAVFFIVLAFWLKDAFPVTVTTLGNAGVSLWDAMYRHMSPALIPLFMLPLWWDYHTDRRAAKLAEADRLTPTYFETAEEDTVKPVKQKRSVRARIRKSEVTIDISKDI